MDALVPKLNLQELIEKEGVFSEIFVSRWLMEADISIESKKSYRKWIYYFIEYLQFRNIKQPQDIDVINYKQFLRDQGLSGYTISAYITAVRRFTEWLEYRRIYPDIAKRVKIEKRSESHRREALSRDQGLKLLSVINNLRDKALVILLMCTGIRLCSAHRANWEDISSKGEKKILWIQNKGKLSKDNWVILESPVFKILTEYQRSKACKETDSIFTTESPSSFGYRLSIKSMGRIIRDYMREAKVKPGINVSSRICPHSLRHSAATYSIIGGANIRKSQAMLCHSSIVTTEKYLHSLDRLEDSAEEAVIEYLGL